MTLLRHATIEDLSAVLDLWTTAGAEPTVTDDEAALSELLRFAPHSLLVASDADRIVGTLIIGWDGWRGSFYRLVVATGHRRRGLGRLLVAEGEAQLRRAGSRRLSVFAVASDTRAVSFWRALGYEPQADRQRLVKD